MGFGGEGFGEGFEFQDGFDSEFDDGLEFKFNDGVAKDVGEGNAEGDEDDKDGVKTGI